MLDVGNVSELRFLAVEMLRLEAQNWGSCALVFRGAGKLLESFIDCLKVSHFSYIRILKARYR
jgi:hypothetical protein